ncbi:MAG: hypothetical protein KatS3mg095_0915 [Candidatus Parcubacteria bacterium]|nr:MAG: hypothetical protein KatS3mg095_0915 [Candidatus Parcubacteria bacterium]
MKNRNFVEEEIIKKFKLFKGLRSIDEDEKILNKVYQLCLNEMLYFLEEIISSEEKEKIIQDIYSDKELADVFLRYLKDEFNLWRLKIRISKFLDNLLFELIYNGQRSI